MIAWLIAVVTGLGVPSKLAKPVLAIVGAIALVGALWGLKSLYDHRVIASHEAKIEQRAAPATDQAATERAKDVITTTQHEQELHNVIAAQPDQPISPSSHALACKRLHDAGRNPPACR